MSSYMVANERALRRGIGLSFAAALLQGTVAIVLIGVMTLILHATADRMKAAASWVETASFLAIVGLGLGLVWRKGRGLWRAWRALRETWPRAGFGSNTFGPQLAAFAVPQGSALAFRPAATARLNRFNCDDATDSAHPEDCRHCHAVDPSRLGTRTFDWRSAVGTVLAAGMRPCSGAILVLVFAFAQGVFGVGVLSVLAMSVGVAVTTAVLAMLAVSFKATAARLVGRTSPRGRLVAAGIEFLAACVVLAAGGLLLGGYATLLGS